MSKPFPLRGTRTSIGGTMTKDPVERLEDTRQTLIKKLLERKHQIESQLKGLGYPDEKKASV